MRLKIALAALSLCLPVLVIADSSRVSSDLSYQMADFSQDLRLPRGYRMNMRLFSLNFSGKSEDDDFVFTMRVPAELLRMGFFTFKRSQSELPLSAMDKNVSEAYSEFSITGNHNQINEVLATLSYERASRVENPMLYKIEYILANKDYMYDQWTQTVTFPSSIGYEAIQNTSSTVLDPDVDFKFPLFKVTEDPIVQSDVVIRMHSASNSQSFFTLTIIQGIVFIQGRTPTSMHQTSAGRYTTTIVFEFYNARTGDQSGMLTYYLELNPSKVRDSEVIVFYIYGAVFAIFFLSVVGFVIYAIKRDHQLKKDSVRNAINQQEVPQENVLTRSILEWTKNGTSTRDQTEKGQVSSIMSTNDRYSLKKGKKPGLQYKGLKPLADKDNTTNQSEDQSVEITGHLDSDMGPQQPKKDPLDRQQAKSDEEPAHPKDHRPVLKKPESQPEAAGELDKDLANFTKTQRDLVNLSQFGISAIGYIDQSMVGYNPKFNQDMSVSEMGMNQPDDVERKVDLNLEEMNIILKDL